MHTWICHISIGFESGSPIFSLALAILTELLQNNVPNQSFDYGFICLIYIRNPFCLQLYGGKFLCSKTSRHVNVKVFLNILLDKHVIEKIVDLSWHLNTKRQLKLITIRAAPTIGIICLHYLSYINYLV